MAYSLSHGTENKFLSFLPNIFEDIHEDMPILPVVMEHDAWIQQISVFLPKPATFLSPAPHPH